MKISEAGRQDARKAAEELELFLERENLRFIARPYNLINSLSEEIIAAGENYIITGDTNGEGEHTDISILVYNFDREVKNKFMHSESSEEDYEIVRGYNRDVEFLIRFLGLSGEFVISRYLLTKENIEAAYNNSNQPGIRMKREELLNNWRTLPVVEFGKLTISDTLSLSVNLQGLSAELILIDRA